MDSSSEGFVKLREEILEHAIPLLDSDTIPPEDRFRLSLQIAQIKGSIDSYEHAFRVAEKIEGDDRLRAYLDLLGDVDFMIQEQLDVESGAEVGEKAVQGENQNNATQTVADNTTQSGDQQ